MDEEPVIRILQASDEHLYQEGIDDTPNDDQDFFDTEGAPGELGTPAPT